MKLIILFTLQIFANLLIAKDNNPIALDYISNYVEIAQEEMQRTGIPASIKLAQAILESDMGRSDLANEANNHFGIKCGNSWPGKEFYKHDDDKNHKGELIESCFRKFNTPQESFIAHSDFLTDTNKADRYGFLFETTDYKKWSKGLKKAGYATDPKYPDKLISIIEKYELYQYDNFDGNIPFKREKVNSISSTSSRYEYSIETNLRLKYITAFGGESFESIAESVGISLDDILNYNEAFDKRNTILNPGDKVYLSNKKRSFNGDQEKHLVKEGETIYSISQIYGMKTTALYGKNKIPKGAEPIAGEYLFLQKTVSSKERPKYTELKVSKEEVLLWE
jgi:predicted transposase YbfD/YdcC